MVRETNNVCFGQIAQETQVVVREDNKRDLLKRSTEDVSPPKFSERNSGYFERNSRLTTETDSYLRRSNSISYQSSSNNNTHNNKNSTSNNFSNTSDNRSRTRDRLYRNGPNALGISSATSSSASTLLSERTSSGTGTKVNNSRVPPTSWYEAAATYTNGPGGSGNADVSAAKINHYQTAASTELQTATTNSTTTSSYTAYSFASSPAHNTTSATTSSQLRNSTFYRNLPSSGAVQTNSDKEPEKNFPATQQLLNKNKQKLLKSSACRSGSASPTSTTLTVGGPVAVLTTMTSSSSTAASTPSSSSLQLSSSNNNSNNTITNSRSNQTANNSCSSVSSTINNSNTNNSLSGNISNVTNTDNAHSSGSANSSITGILNAAALAAASKGGSLSTDSNKNSSNSGSVANCHSTSNNQSISASHHTSRSAAHGHFHGRSCTSSSRSHSRSPSSYSSSHSSSSSSSSTASSHSHACSPVGGRDVDSSSVANVTSSRSGSRSLQSAVAVPSTSSGLNPSGSNLCGSSSSSTSSNSSSTPTGNPVVHSEDNRPLAIRVRNLPARSSDTSLKDGLFHEYKKHGKVTWVKVVGQNAERYALVCFKKPEDVEKALEVSHDKLFFGCKIEVEPYQGYDVEDNEFRPYEAELDEYHPKSTRTLFIGNLEKEITANELRQHFECFGEIIEIDIKKQGMSAYAFCQYSDIVSVVKAMRKMDGEHLGNNRIKLGFGKSMPTNCVWIDGIGEKISESHLQSQFLRYGAVSKVVVDRQRQLALVLYEQIQYAQTAVKEMRGATLRGRKLQVDFASRECQDAFYEKLEKQNSGPRFNRYDSQSRSRASSFSRHQNSNDGCSPNNTPGSSSSSSAGVISSTPALSSAIVTGASAISGSNTTGGNTVVSVVGQTTGSTTPARSRGSRSSRHTMDYEYQDSRRFRSCDEYSQGSATSHDEDNTSGNHSASNTNSYSGIGLRSDSPLLSRLGPIVNNSGKESSIEIIEMALSRRRCDKSPAKQKGDIRLFQKERAVLLEQLEECPSSGDESIVSPRKRIKIDHHSISSSCGLTQSHSLDEPQQPQHNKNSNCDYLLNDPMHRKSEVRRLSECNSSLNKYLTPQQNHHHSHHVVQPSPHHHHHQQQLSRRPSNDFMATSGSVGGVLSSISTRHNSTSSSSSEHHPQHHQGLSSSSLACKRRRMIGSGSNALASTSSLISASASTGSNLSSFANDESYHHSSRGRGHQLHSHHSHEASGGESADGSRPGTPLCDERPEVLPSEPRRVPRERPREPMILSLPKFGIQFFQQHRNNAAMGSSSSYHNHHYVSGSFTSSSSLGGTTNSGSSSHLLSNSILNRGDIGTSSNNSHSSLSHSSTTTTSTSTTTMGTSSGSCYLPSPSTRFPPHWRPHHHHHHHQQPSVTHYGPSGAATPSSSSSMVSPLRSRSLSSNSSDSDVPGQSSSDSPSLEERIRTLDEMYERWSGKANNNNATSGSNVAKRLDYNHTPPTWQHHRSNSQTESLHGNNSDVRSTTNPPIPASRHKFLDIDVNELQPSEIVKSVLAKKSIFDDDLQRLKKNHWYEPISDTSHLSKTAGGICPSPGLPNLQPTKTPVVGYTTSLQSSVSNSLNKPSSSLLQRLSSLSPMNSPQASTSPYNSPSASPSVLNSVSLVSTNVVAKSTSVNSSGVSGSQITTTTAGPSTSPSPTGGTKCLQYPFPTHPPLPNTAAPIQSAQPIPPPPAEILKPSLRQPPLPPIEVLQPPQPPASSPTSVQTVGSSAKPKISALSKSLSVPSPQQTTATESRIFTKSVSVPGSTNLVTVKSIVDSSEAPTFIEQNKPHQIATGNSSLQSSKAHKKEDDIIAKPSSLSSSALTAESLIKRNEKQHKHNHRSNEEKKSSKSDKRKSSNALQTHQLLTSAAESSDADEVESRKDRNERREKEIRRQQEREERERQERERFDQEQKERLEREERERAQREKERIRKEEEHRLKEEKERKEKDGKELKKKEEIERRERVEKEERLRREQIEKEEQEQKDKKKIESQREEKERATHSDHTHTLVKEHILKCGSNTNQTTLEFLGEVETERQNNKENSTVEVSPISDPSSTSNCKQKSRKNSRNTSPARYPKRRLSSQDNNVSNNLSMATIINTDDQAKRIRIDSQSVSNQQQTQINNHSSSDNVIDEKRDSKEHHGKDRNSKHNRLATLSHKSSIASTAEKEQNFKHHRNKNHHKAHSTQGVIEAINVHLNKNEIEQTTSNCTSRLEEDKQSANHGFELKPTISLAHSSDDEEQSENISTSTPHSSKTLSSHHKHKEHVSGHHSRHKSNKREKEHHRDKKKHSSSAAHPNLSNVNESVPSTPLSSSSNVIDEETISSPGNQLSFKRMIGQNADNKPSRCSEERSVVQSLTSSNRQNNLNKNIPLSSKKLIISSAEDTDGGGGVVGMGLEDDDSDNRQHSIFDIPDDGPYISMYDKVKARSCKNMQKQEEEKKIKAKFSQLKQSRAKREEKKRSTSYDGDSDSDFDNAGSEQQKQLNRSCGSFKMHTGGLTSTTDEEHDVEVCDQTPSRDRRRSSQASSSATSIHPHRLCSDSDDNSIAQRRLKLKDNLRRLCDDGDETSEDDLIRRHKTGLANKRLLHHTSRIASDSESQSAVDLKLKQEPLETSNDGTTTPVLKSVKNKIKKEVVDVIEAASETSDFCDFKFKGLRPICSSADDHNTVAHKIKAEATTELLSANEIKKELKAYYSEEYLQSETKFQKSPIVSASQLFSPEQTKIKKHKKSKRRQKTPTQESLAQDEIVADTLIKQTNLVDNTGLFSVTNDIKNSKMLTSPCFDVFDELKRGETLVSQTATELQIIAEKKRHKDRKEKKREKQRHFSADLTSGVELDKTVHEKEKHRLKKSKKSKSVDVIRQTSATIVNDDQTLIASPSCTSQQKQRSSGEKMEDIFGPISDEDEDLTDSDIGGRDLNCIPNRNTSSSNMQGPIVSAALNPYKQEPLTPKSHTVEENEENKQKLLCSSIMGASSHLERVAERQHRKEKREKKRREREKSRSSEHNHSIGFTQSPIVSATKPIDDENSVDLDAAGRALEAQLMEDSDNKTLEDATPSTANTYRSDMTDVFLFSDCDENSIEMSSTNKHEKKETEKEHTLNMSGKPKEKKKKKKRSKEEKQLHHHQRRESSSSNASQLATNLMTSCSNTSKLTIDVQAGIKLAQKTSDEHMPASSSPLCKPSPSLPCLIGDDDDDITIPGSNITPNNVSSPVCTTPQRSSSKDILTLTPHLKDKQVISPIPKTPTINNTNSNLNAADNLNKNKETSPSTPTSSHTGAIYNSSNTTPTSSITVAAKSINKPLDSSTSGLTAAESPATLTSTTQKKKTEIFIPGFDGEIDAKISESAVQSISAEFNSPMDSMTDEPKIPVESPPDASKLEKLEESTKSRVTISQEETESAVSALLGESFGNSSADYSFNDDDDDGLVDLNNAIREPEPVMPPGEQDEEAALAAKAIECEVASSSITDNVEDDSEEVCKAIQSLRQEELDIKADTPQSVRELQIDTDTEENADEADSSGSHSLKIDETAQSNNSSTTSDKENISNPAPQSEEKLTIISKDSTKNDIKNSSVITKVDAPIKTKKITSESAETKIEPPTITKQDQPAIQPVQDVLQTVTKEAPTLSSTTPCSVAPSSSLSTTSTNPAITMSYTSTPIKYSLVSTMVSSTSSHTLITSGNSLTSANSSASPGYIMQPPTITIPDPGTHFVVPQLVISPRGPVSSALHNDSSTSSTASLHSPNGHHMPAQSPVGAAYLMGARSQSPHSPRQHTSRGNTPTPRQTSPHTSTPTPPPIVVTPQQQSIILQRTVKQHTQKLASPPHSNSPLASPKAQQRHQVVPMHKSTLQQAVLNTTPEQHMIKINNYSTPPSQTMNMVNISMSQPPQQHHSQQSSPQQSLGKTVIEPQHVAPIGQHVLPISVQKMPPVPTHPTIISKVVTVTPQQAQQSMMQQPAGHNTNMFSPPTLGSSAINSSSRQSPQLIQQMNPKAIQQQQQQQSQQIQLMQQQQRQQQHMMQFQHQQHIIHQQQKVSQQQQSQQNFAVSQQNKMSPAQPTPQQAQNAQQVKYQQQHQQQMLPTSQSPAQQQNVIQNSSVPQRFLVQQHIIGMPQQQQQQQPHTVSQSQQQQAHYPQNSSTQQKLAPIFSSKQLQQQYQQRQQSRHSPSPQRLFPQQSDLTKDSSRVIISSNLSSQQNESLLPTTATSNANVENQRFSPITTTAAGALATASQQGEGISVIKTPTPTSVVATKTLPQPITAASSKDNRTATYLPSTSRSAPLTEENVIKISPPKHEENEQDSKEDSDYWSAKELNVVEGVSNASSVSSVIQKNESISASETPSQPISNLEKASSQEDKKSASVQCDKNETKSSLEATKTDIHSVLPSEAALAPTAFTPSQSQCGNVTTDHETEDETETQHMPAFEQVPVQGRPSTRGTGGKRGRQPRGGKKSTCANALSALPNTSINTKPLQVEVESIAGVQTRLRKPNATTPPTRGRKGRPPRNLLLQQQQSQQQQQQEQLITTPTTSTATPSISSSPTAVAPTTTAEKKIRSQATASANMASLSESNQQPQHQDVYEFHDESGDEIKTCAISAVNASSATTSDQRPRLILTIKSPAQGSTHLVKAIEKTLHMETQQETKPTEEPTQHQESQAPQPELTSAELAAAAITRKSRRLLEKDRSTIDDIIEDVVRNTATNVPGTNAAAAGANLSSSNVSNVATNTLPKGSQTPPRRSGRNSSQSKPFKTVEIAPQTTANPIGRPRKSKDRKNTNDLETEQLPSPQQKPLVHDDVVEDTKAINSPSPMEASATQVPISKPQSTQAASSSTTIYAPSSQQQLTLQTVTTTQSSIPQHPKKKVLAAAEIESYQTSAAPTSSTPNIHSSIPAAGVPMLNTAAPASQKATGGAADSINKPLIDPVTGVLSGYQMQRAKEGNLPCATAASQPIRSPMDPKKLMQAAAAAAAVENISINSKLQNQSSLLGAAATPVTALTKPVHIEATSAQVATSTVATAMLNKSVSVVVKTTTIPPSPSSPSNTAMHQQQQQQQMQHLQRQQPQQRPDITIPLKQTIIMQQQVSPVMHAQHTNVRPPTSLKAHVLNSQKLQQQQQSNQQQYAKQQLQQQTHQTLQPQTTTCHTGVAQQTSSHIIQNAVQIQIPAAVTTTATASTQQQQQQITTTKQLLVNIPPSTSSHPSHANISTLNSPRHILQHSQQQQPQLLSSQHSLVIKQAHDLHPQQVLHVVSSKTNAPAMGPNKSAQSMPSTVLQQPSNVSPHHQSYTSYIQTPTSAGHTKPQLPQQPVVLHQQTIGVQSKNTTTPLVIPPGILGLPPHPAMVIQTKTSAPIQSPSSVTSHMQHTPSPPLQASAPHLVKSSNNTMIHSIQTQAIQHNLNTAAATSSASAAKPNAQQSSITSNVGASSLRTAIPTISPQSQTHLGSILLPSGLQVPPHFETSMHEIPTYGSAVTGSVRATQSPPPAHQQASPITPSEASFPGGMGRVGVPTREHLMIYQQLLRQHDSLNPSLREFDEKLLGSSPPLELRRPGSVPRTVAVPHSLQSPQDRSTDSPQVAQVYVHNTRIPAHSHYDVTGRPAVTAQPSGYYDATRQINLEPPPAHRSAAVHSTVVAPPPSAVVVPHSASGSSSPFMPAVPPAAAIQGSTASGLSGHHPKLLEREREQRERDREQHLLRDKEQIMIRADGHNMQVAAPKPHQQSAATHQLPPHSQQPPPPQADSLLTLLQRYPVMWQGLLALKTDQAAVQMHFVFGNPHVARASLPCNDDGSTPPLRIAQRMRLEQTQLEGVAKKMQFENEHCMLLALPCGRDHADVLQQSRNLQSGFITYLQQKMAAGIVNIPLPGSEQADYVVHIFPSCDFANENLEKAAPDLKNRVADIAHLLIVIATV